MMLLPGLRLFPLVLLLLPLSAFSQNLLVNPGFEEVDQATGTPVGWTARVTETPVELRVDGGHQGDRYVRMVDKDPAAGIMYESQRVPSRPGGLYRATAWFRTADKCSPGVYLNFYDEAGTRIHNLYTRVQGPTEGWMQAAVETTAPVDALLVSTAVYAYTADVGTIDADDVEMTVQGGREPGQGRIPRAQPGDKQMVDLGSRRELFVDSFLLDGLSGQVGRELHHPQPQNIALTFDQPWEGPVCVYVSVVNDDGKVRLYYRGWNSEGAEACTCMAESEDGVHFTKPNLGLYEFKGSRDNNIVWMGAGTHNFTPFKDPNPAAPADQRYKAVASAGPKSSLVPFASPDGIHWRKLQEEPVITEGAFDSQNLAFWDELRGEYVEFHRGFRNGVRDIMMSTSKDFLHWTQPAWLDYGDAPAEHLYTNATLPYFRAPHIYLGFPCRFVPNRKKVPEHSDLGINDGVLMSSRDGLHFERWVEAFLRPALDPLCWTDRNNYISWGMAQTSPTELSLYWNEHYRYPSAYLRRGTVRLDGFVSVHGGGEGGEMLTRPFTFAGKALSLNYETSAMGYLRCELCDEQGTAYPGFSFSDNDVLYGNELDRLVSWQGKTDVSSLAGKTVRLRVQLRDADLYSLQFTQ